jgi:hypothetical protein
MWTLTEAPFNLPALDDAGYDALKQNYANQAYLNQRQGGPQSTMGAMGQAALKAGADMALDAVPGGKMAQTAYHVGRAAMGMAGQHDLNAQAQQVGINPQHLQISNPKVKSVLDGSGMKVIQKIATNPNNVQLYQKYQNDYINAVAREWISSMIGGNASGMMGEASGWGDIGKAALGGAADMAADSMGMGTAYNLAKGTFDVAKAGMGAHQANQQHQQMLQQGQQLGIPPQALQSWNPNVKAVLDGSSMQIIPKIAVNPKNAQMYQKLGPDYVNQIAIAYIKAKALQAQK